MRLRTKLVIGGMVASIAMAVPTASAQLGSAFDKGERAVNESKRIQASINNANTEANDLVREYRDLITKTASAKVYASQQQARVEGQREELVSIENQLSRVDEIVEQAAPMMVDMIDDLELFVQNDLPFKREKRLSVIEDLRDLMNSATVTDAERYRKIIESYTNELEYGRTVQTWAEPVEKDGQEVEYDYFLYGRVALVRMNEVAGKAERWSRSQGGWVDLPSSSLNDIKKSMRIADKKAPPAVMMAVVEKFSVYN